MKLSHDGLQVSSSDYGVDPSVDGEGQKKLIEPDRRWTAARSDGLSARELLRCSPKKRQQPASKPELPRVRTRAALRRTGHGSIERDSAGGVPASLRIEGLRYLTYRVARRIDL